MKFTPTVIALLMLSVPLTALPQSKHIRLKTIEGTVVGREESPRWAGIVVESGGTRYVVPIMGGRFEGTQIVGGDVSEVGTPVRVTYSGRDRWGTNAFLLRPSRIVNLSAQSVTPRGRSRQAITPRSGDWDSFWTAFRAAINARDRTSLMRMMATPFESSGLENTPAKWVKFMDETEGVWEATARAVQSGTKPFPEYSRDIGRPSRITNMRYLIFVLGKDGRWRWAGLMGD